MKKLLLFSVITLGTGNLFAQTIPDPFSPDPPLSSHYYYENKGQIIDNLGVLHPEIKYYTEKTSPALYLADDKISFVVIKKADTTTAPGSIDSTARIDLQFVCDKTFNKLSEDAHKSGLACGDIKVYEQSGDVLNYYLPQCPTGIENVEGFARVVYQNAFNNIDVHFYSNIWGVKTYFVVKPGGNPNDIKLLFTGQDNINTIPGGGLAMGLGGWQMTLPQPTAYQFDSLNNVVPTPAWSPGWVNNGAGAIGVTTGSYDASKPLVITIGNQQAKPTGATNLEWSVYYGAEGGEGDENICANENAIVYHALDIQYGTFPSQNGATGTTFSPTGATDWYVSKLNTDCSRAWATYYGGTGDEYPSAVKETFPAQNTGEVWVCGATNSPKLYLGQQTGTFKQTYNGGVDGSASTFDGLLATFNKTNGTLYYATYYGGKYTDDYITDMSIDNVYNTMYFAGHLLTKSGNGANYNTNCATSTNGNFPLCAPAGQFSQTTKYGYGDAEGFIAQIGLTSRDLKWSTLFGGAGADLIYSILKVNSIDNALYIGGYSASDAGAAPYPSGIATHNVLYFPFADPGNGAFFQTSSLGYQNYFIAKFDKGNRLAWSTFLGKTQTDGIRSLALNSKNELYFLGTSALTSFQAPFSALPNNNGLIPRYTNGTSFSQNISNSGYNFVIGKFGSNLSLKWSTLIKGTNSSIYNPAASLTGGYLHGSIGVNSSDYVFVTAAVDLGPSPVFNASGSYWQPQNAAQNMAGATPADGYILELNSNEQPVWGTFFGGAIANPNGAPYIGSFDAIYDLALVGNQYLYVTGTTDCAASPYNECLMNSYCDVTYNANFDGFISRFKLTPTLPPLAINEIKNDAGNLVLYPNPTKGIVSVRYIETNNAKEISIFILDALGRKVKETSLKVNQGINDFKIDMTGMANATYILELNNGTHQVSGKFVKQ